MRMNQKIVHVGSCALFIPPFIEFIKEHFNFNEHEFLLTHGVAENALKTYPNVYIPNPSKLSKLKHYKQTFIKMQSADKIILHGLFDIKIVQILFLSPWLLKKCYWLVWGGDLYTYQIGPHNKKWHIREFFRKPVIRNMGYLVTSIDGDYELAKKWYKAKGKFINSFYYTTNLFVPLTLQREARSTIYILVGNSATPTNNHREILEKLKKYRNEDIIIYVPLNYGNQAYAEEIISFGKRLFGSKFKPIINHMNKEDYIQFLNQIDIAIFNHNRQQGMGTTRSLLGMGKKVYMNQAISSSIMFRKKGIKTFSLENLDLNYKFPESKKNIERIRELYSTEELIKGLSHIFK